MMEESTDKYSAPPPNYDDAGSWLVLVFWSQALKILQHLLWRLLNLKCCMSLSSINLIKV